MRALPTDRAFDNHPAKTPSTTSCMSVLRSTTAFSRVQDSMLPEEFCLSLELMILQVSVLVLPGNQLERIRTWNSLAGGL